MYSVCVLLMRSSHHNSGCKWLFHQVHSRFCQYARAPTSSVCHPADTRLAFGLQLTEMLSCQPCLWRSTVACLSQAASAFNGLHHDASKHRSSLALLMLIPLARACQSAENDQQCRAGHACCCQEPVDQL